jgi:hypothetical protein
MGRIVEFCMQGVLRRMSGLVGFQLKHLPALRVFGQAARFHAGMPAHPARNWSGDDAILDFPSAACPRIPDHPSSIEEVA